MRYITFVRMALGFFLVHSANTVSGMGYCDQDARVVATTSDGMKSYFIDSVDHTIRVLDISTNQISIIADGAVPSSFINLSKDNTRAYVGNNEGLDISVIDTATDTMRVMPTKDAGNQYIISETGNGIEIYTTINPEFNVLVSSEAVLITTDLDSLKIPFQDRQETQEASIE